MRRNYFFSVLCFVLSPFLFAQVGINTTTPDPSAMLDVVSSDKGVLLPRVANIAAVTHPISDGLLIYDNSSHCLRGYQNGNWSACWGVSANASTNGTSKVSAYNCSIQSVGTLTQGVPVSGVTQTITAEVAEIGTYHISAVANGVTFSNQGTFLEIGAQNIVLTATGTPLMVETNDFTLNTISSCRFSRSTSTAN